MLSLVALVTVLAVLFYAYTGVGVAFARRESKIDAPAMTGHPALERAVRVQMNTLEWMPIFLTLLWLSVLFPAIGSLTAPVAAALGLVWILGRWLYMTGYMSDPSKRSTGYLIQALTCIVLMLGAVVGAVMRLIAGG